MRPLTTCKPTNMDDWERLEGDIKAYRSGHYLEGIKFAEKAYQYALKNFGETDQDTLTSINNLAALYDSQGLAGKVWRSRAAL
ncbi:hypothetical protein MHK_007716 [Candidatus Magnetomorum sp. HK-1]|nr:hypothetical protein MHK_007716 [Candidatus Magnetomorum sp. HK-1]